jgi:murein DD-endopeptidase MepM/ murein hydrolase activator NlpD
VIPALAACFLVGMISGWSLKSGAPLPVDSELDRRQPISTALPGANPSSVNLAGAREENAAGTVAATTGEPLIGPEPPSIATTISELRRHRLQLPIEDAEIDTMKGGFTERRDGGGRAHEAVDILAPRHTPIHAVDGGSIAKLFTSKAGGITIYQFDASGGFCYYYAHLERYAPGLREGQAVSRGDVLGYVGTSGNAPPGTPHLHFAVFELDKDRRWWKGRAIDPYLIFQE